MLFLMKGEAYTWGRPTFYTSDSGTIELNWGELLVRQ